jgi:hypothetical protein
MIASTPRDLIALWPSLQALADDLSYTGVTILAVRKWSHRKRIPSEYWFAVVNAAAERGIKGVTLEALAELDAKRLAGREPIEARA